MNENVLVAYATRYGSTREVAEAVAGALRELGLTVEVRAAGEVASLEPYQAVVLGAPLYIGHWHKEAQQFLTRHQAELSRRPSAVFSLGPTTSAREDWRGARESLDEELSRFPGFCPVAAELFGGKYDPARLSFAHRLLAALPASPLHNLPASDQRDWDAIRTWAASLAGRLRPAAGM